MFSNYQIVKILQNCFQNIKRVSCIKLISVLIHLKYSYYNTPFLELPISRTISDKLHPGQLKILFNTILIIFCIVFPVLPYTTNLTTRYKYCIYQTICQAKPLKFIIKLCADHRNLWVKHTTHKKAESLRAASLSNLDKIVNSNSIFNTKFDEFSTKWQELLNFQKPTCTYNHHQNLHQKFIPLLQPILTSLIRLTCS